MLSQEIMYPTEKKRKGITDSETKQCNAKEREAVMMSKLDDEGMWRNFSQTTGFHGLNKITFETKHTRQIIRSVCWMVVWMTCAVFLIYTVVVELRNYYSYPTTSNTIIEVEERLQFPAVTICNMSPRKSIAFPSDEKTTNLYMRTSAFYWGTHEVNWSDPFYAEGRYFEPITLEDIHSESKDMKEFLNFIMFNGKEYSYNELTTVYTDMGLCKRFNANGTIYTSMYGALYNLHLYINVMTYFDYFSHLCSSGVKIAIHDHGVEPIMVNEGIVVQPATEGYIEIQRKEYKFLPAPFIAFGNQTCVNKPNYSSSNCLQSCWNEIIREKCGCTDFLSRKNNIYCSYFEYMTCSNPTFWHLLMSYHTESCTCPSECNYIKYGYSFSSGKYPSDFFAKQLSRLFGLTTEFVQKNLALVRIYYKDLSKTVTEQSPKYENAGDIFANLGGQLGLFLGASILSITELIEFVVVVVYTMIQKIINKRQPVSGTPVVEFKQDKF